MAKFKKIAAVACSFFSAAALIYTGALALFMGGRSAVAGAYGLLFKNIAVLFVYSWAMGALELVFELRLSSAAKRVIHAFALYAFTLAAGLMMADPGKDARRIVLFIFILTLVYIVLYTATVLIMRVIKKARGE